MSRRGHATGIITTYEYTWLLKTDKAGTVWVSDPIHCSNAGDSKRASVTEARHLTISLERVMSTHNQLMPLAVSDELPNIDQQAEICDLLVTSGSDVTVLSFNLLFMTLHILQCCRCCCRVS